VIVAIRLHNQQSNNFREGQQQNAKWSGLARYLRTFPAFPVGSLSKGVNYMPSGLRGQCPQAGLWLLTCHITNIILIFRAAGGKIWGWRLCTVTKVGVARRPQKHNISPHRCLNPLRFLVFDSETADKPVSDEKSHFPLRKL